MGFCLAASVAVGCLIEIRLIAALGRRREMARIIALIAQGSGERVPVSTVAAHLGVTSRTLRSWCMVHFGTPPARLLREQRLIRAHHALVTADPRSTTVTEIAMQFGFSELGRFAVRYREAFGERPLDTLRRPSLWTRPTVAAPPPLV